MPTASVLFNNSLNEKARRIYEMNVINIAHPLNDNKNKLNYKVNERNQEKICENTEQTIRVFFRLQRRANEKSAKKSVC